MGVLPSVCWLEFVVQNDTAFVFTKGKEVFSQELKTVIKIFSCSFKEELRTCSVNHVISTRMTVTR